MSPYSRCIFSRKASESRLNSGITPSMKFPFGPCGTSVATIALAPLPFHFLRRKIPRRDLAFELTIACIGGKEPTDLTKTRPENLDDRWLYLSDRSGNDGH